MIIAGVFGCLALLFAAMFLFSKPKQSGVQSTSSDPAITIETQPAQIEEPKYTIDISSVSEVITRPHSITYKATITNISVEPYITNFAFYKCQLEDEEGVTHEGRLMTETTFDQAIMPGKSQSITVNDPISVSGFQSNRDSGFEKCEYKADGIKQCKTLSTLKVQSCTAYITTDGSQASNEWGDYPTEAVFPN